MRWRRALPARASLAAAFGQFLAWALLIPTAAFAQDTAPDFGAATVANQSYVLGSAITDLVLPEATGGNGPLTYALSPSPPEGLSFNAGTRTLSGTPTEAQAATYTHRVTDGGANTATRDADELTFTITVAATHGCAGSTAVGGSAVTTGGLVDDCEALLASEAALVGAGTALNWDTATAMGSWTGVILSDSRVAELRLFEQSLAGSIPAKLGELSSLTELYLDGNSLTGSIPGQLGNLSSLERLDLQDNMLTLATYGALLAARSIEAVLRGRTTEQLAMDECESRARQEFALFYAGVSGVYDMGLPRESYIRPLRERLRNSNGVRMERVCSPE